MYSRVATPRRRETLRTSTRTLKYFGRCSLVITSEAEESLQRPDRKHEYYYYYYYNLCYFLPNYAFSFILKYEKNMSSQCHFVYSVLKFL